MLEGKTKTPLSQTEYDLVGEAIYRLVRQYPFPDFIEVTSDLETVERLAVEKPEISYLTSNAKENICVIPIPENALYQKRFITGGFEATVNFQIAYKCFPRSDKWKIASQKVVDGIMRWLENAQNLPALTDDRAIIKIQRLNSFAAVEENGGDGNVVFVSAASLTYRKTEVELF